MPGPHRQETTHLGECREVGGEKSPRAAARLDLGDDAGASLGIAAMHQDASPGLPELAGDQPADPSVEPVTSAVFPLSFSIPISLCRAAEYFFLPGNQITGKP